MSENQKKATPKTKLKFEELLGDRSISKLAKVMGVTYTQLYPYKKKGANPTLLALEQLANGLSELRNEEVSILDLLDYGQTSKTKKNKK